MQTASNIDSRAARESWDLLALLLISEPKPGQEALYKLLTEHAVERLVLVPAEQDQSATGASSGD